MSENTDFQIVTDVPPPLFRGYGPGPGPITVALRKLATAPIGASMYVPGKRPAMLGPYIKSAVGARGVLVSRTEGDGSRVWKIAEPPAKA